MIHYLCAQIVTPPKPKTGLAASSFVDDVEKSVSSLPQAPPKGKKKAVKISAMSPTSPGEEKFQFSSQDKKAKPNNANHKAKIFITNLSNGVTPKMFLKHQDWFASVRWWTANWWILPNVYCPQLLPAVLETPP